MPSHSSGRSRRKKKQDQEFVKPGKRSTTLPIFVLTLIGLLAAAAVWSATRDRSRPIPVDTSDGGQKSIAAIQATKSWKRLETASDEIEQRISGQAPSEVRDLLKVYLALAERQLELASQESQKTAALTKQLNALKGLAASEPESKTRLRLATELSALGLKLTGHADDALASQAFQSLFMASELILVDGLNDEEDTTRLSSLLATWIEQASQRFPTDQSICEAIGNLFTRYPNVEDRDRQLLSLVDVIRKGYGKSPNPAVVEWAGRVEIKQFFDENKVLSLLTNALTQATLQPDQLKGLEDQLVTDKPTIAKLLFAVQLARIYEGFGQVEAMQRLLARIQALDLSQIDPQERAQLEADCRKMSERQALRGQQLSFDLVLRDGTQLSAEQMGKQVVMLVFFDKPEELEKVDYYLGSLRRIPVADFRYFLVVPDMNDEEWGRLSAMVNPNDPNFRLPLVAPEEEKKLRDKFLVTTSVFTVIIDGGKVASLGDPLNRVQLWLEGRLSGN